MCRRMNGSVYNGERQVPRWLRCSLAFLIWTQGSNLICKHRMANRRFASSSLCSHSSPPTFSFSSSHFLIHRALCGVTLKSLQASLSVQHSGSGSARTPPLHCRSYIHVERNTECVSQQYKLHSVPLLSRNTPPPPTFAKNKNKKKIRFWIINPQVVLADSPIYVTISLWCVCFGLIYQCMCEDLSKHKHIYSPNNVIFYTLTHKPEDCIVNTVIQTYLREQILQTHWHTHTLVLAKSDCK